MSTSRIPSILAVLLIALAPLTAQAMGTGGAAMHGALAPPQAADYVIAQRDGKTLAQAIEQVRRKYDVQRIVDAKTQRRGNREVHVIKFMTRDGTVKTETIQGRRLD